MPCGGATRRLGKNYAVNHTVLDSGISRIIFKVQGLFKNLPKLLLKFKQGLFKDFKDLSENSSKDFVIEKLKETSIYVPGMNFS